MKSISYDTDPALRRFVPLLTMKSVDGFKTVPSYIGGIRGDGRVHNVTPLFLGTQCEHLNAPLFQHLIGVSRSHAVNMGSYAVAREVGQGVNATEC